MHNALIAQWLMYRALTDPVVVPQVQNDLISQWLMHRALTPSAVITFNVQQQTRPACRLTPSSLCSLTRDSRAFRTCVF